MNSGIIIKTTIITNKQTFDMIILFWIGKWISPELIGDRPPPCAAFSFTRVDKYRVVLFGGRQLKERTDHLYILDMEKWVIILSLNIMKRVSILKFH